MPFVIEQDLIRERTFEREDIQKKTFTKWINKHLSSGGQQGEILRFRGNQSHIRDFKSMNDVSNLFRKNDKNKTSKSN